jgi:hypothetical protein
MRTLADALLERGLVTTQQVQQAEAAKRAKAQAAKSYANYDAKTKAKTAEA